jgi:hypothetical protein
MFTGQGHRWHEAQCGESRDSTEPPAKARRAHEPPPDDDDARERERKRDDFDEFFS